MIARIMGKHLGVLSDSRSAQIHHYSRMLSPVQSVASFYSSLTQYTLHHGSSVRIQQGEESTWCEIPLYRNEAK